ncbi:hypothetical protein BGZ76_011807, partial [Entomortierella beljakovae]
MSKQKLEYHNEKDLVNERHNIERSSVILEEEENSHIPEVATIISNRDDPTMPTS